MCEKISYQTEHDAREACKSTSKRKRISMYKYYCSMCNGWHLATSKRMKKIRMRPIKQKYKFKLK